MTLSSTIRYTVSQTVPRSAESRPSGSKFAMDPESPSPVGGTDHSLRYPASCVRMYLESSEFRMLGKASSSSAATELPTMPPEIQAFFNELNISGVPEGNSSVIFQSESDTLAYNEDTPFDHPTANPTGSEIGYSYGPAYEHSFSPQHYSESYNPVDESRVELDQVQTLQGDPGRITINEPLNGREEVQIHGDRSHHHLSPVRSCGGDVFSPSYLPQLSGYQVDCPHNQLDAQFGIPLTGPSNEAVGAPGCIVGNIANVSPDPHANLNAKRQGMIDKLSRNLNPNVVREMFRKFAKERVGSYKAQLASDRRRMGIAKFLCLVEGCDARFTRKHNLTNHSKSHLGITDYFCPNCGKGFATCATMKRHHKNCSRKMVSSKKALMAPPGVLADLQKVVRSSLNQP